jgi:hypothetical protein
MECAVQGSPLEVVAFGRKGTANFKNKDCRSHREFTQYESYYLRNDTIFLSHLHHQFLALLVGTIYFGQEYDQAGVISMSGALFWATTNQAFLNYSAVLSVRFLQFDMLIAFCMFRSVRVISTYRLSLSLNFYVLTFNRSST